MAETEMQKLAIRCNMTIRNNECETHSVKKRQKNENTEAKNQCLLEHSQERDFLLKAIISVLRHQLQLFKTTYFVCFSFAVLHIYRILSKPNVELYDCISLL